MAIIVEDGTIVANANSYVSEADLTAYATQRGITLTAGKEQLLIKAMDYLETLNYIGTKKTEGQSLQWPRDEVYIDGYYIESTTIPQELKNAQMMLAIEIDSGNNPLSTIDRATKKEKVDVLEVEYMDNAASTAIIRSVSSMLRKLLKPGAGGTQFMVNRV